MFRAIRVGLGAVAILLGIAGCLYVARPALEIARSYSVSDDDIRRSYQIDPMSIDPWNMPAAVLASDHDVRSAYTFRILLYAAPSIALLLAGGALAASAISPKNRSRVSGVQEPQVRPRV